MSEIDLSIFIVNWNCGELLSECVASVYATVQRHSFEVFVVDNASSDRSAHELKARPNLHLIFNDYNAGFAAANNQAFARSNGRCVLMLNPDTTSLPGALDHLIDYLDTHEDVAAVGPRTVFPDGQLQPSCSHYPTLFNQSMEALGINRVFPNSKVFARPTMTYWKHDAERQVDIISGACLMIRRDALSDVGFLDERFFVYYEEVDLCLRLTQAGHLCIFVPTAQLMHEANHSTKKNLDVRIVTRYRSLLTFYDKHYPRWHGGVLRGLLSFEMLWRMALLHVAGLGTSRDGQLEQNRKRETLDRCKQVIKMCLSSANKTGAKASHIKPTQTSAAQAGSISASRK